MKITNWLDLLGGLALFLYGMQVLSDSLEDAAGDRLKTILEKLTNTKFKGVLVGIGVTAAVQSSSAVTVMLIGFMNASLMTLNRCIWVVMGSNIGTTITAQMIAINVGVVAPVFAVVGVFMCLFFKSRKVRGIGSVMTGFGILFMGLNMMSGAVVPLQKEPVFIKLMTALIQSSGAAVGILSALATKGLVPFSTAAFMVCGLNIGTCITAVLASVTGCRNSKRIATFHVLFNLVGTIFFLIICSATPLLSWIAEFSGTPAHQVANFHTVFNIVTTVIMLPFDAVFMKLIYKLLPIKGEMLAEGSLIEE